MACDIDGSNGISELNRVPECVQMKEASRKRQSFLASQRHVDFFPTPDIDESGSMVHWSGCRSKVETGQKSRPLDQD
jgi:hypothetical protein